MLPIRTDSPMRTTPYVNFGLIALNLIVFLAQAPAHLLAGRYHLLLDPQDPHIWSYITYAFLHQGWMHIFGNMLFLFIFGNNVNDKMGNAAYLAFYLAGAVIAGVGYSLTSDASMLGASGAVSAVTGAYMVLFPQSSITVALFYFFGLFEIPSFIFIAFFFLQDVIFSVNAGESGGGGVAHMAHVSGTVFGFTLCLILLWLRLLPRDRYDILALLSRWNRRRQYRDMVAGGYNPFYATNSDGRSTQQPELSPQETQALAMRAQISNAISAHDIPQAVQIYLQLKQLDPNQVLSRQAQLDIATSLAGQQLYMQAADAYEAFIRTYPKFEQIEQIELMLGLIYARYLQQYAKAREHLVRALAKLHGQREIDMAKSELARIETMS